ALNCWLFYATGGGIGVNYHDRVVDNSLTTAGPDTLDASKRDFDWGCTMGGGVERMFNFWGRRWSLKAEYLYFNPDSQTFHATSGNGRGPFGWGGEPEGTLCGGGLIS